MNKIYRIKKILLLPIIIILTYSFALETYAANDPKIIAKRGGDQFLENTLYAYKKALKMGADGIEVDLQLTRDNIIVAYRHKDLSKMTNCQGSIKNLTYAEIKECNIISNNHDFTNDSQEYTSRSNAIHKIPTLLEILDILPANKMLFLDLKPLPVLPLMEAIIPLLTENNAWNKVVILSPHDVCLKCLYEKYPNAELFEPRSVTNKRLLTLRNEGKCCCDDRHSHYVGFEMSKDMVVEDILRFGSAYTKVNFKLWDDKAMKCTKRAKGNDVKIVFIAVNSQEEYKQAKRLGAYAVFTDNPIALLIEKQE